MEVFIYLTIAVVTLLIGYLKYQDNYWARRGIPHDKPAFFVGNTGELRKTKHVAELFTNTYNKYKGTGPFVGYYFFTIKSIIVLDLELVRNILIKDFHNFDGRGIYHNVRDDPLTGNLFFIDGERWRKLRGKMSPTFTSGKMKHMFEMVSHIGHELSSVVGAKIGYKTGGCVLEITDLLARFTADVIGMCAFGLDCKSLDNPNAEFVQVGKSFFNTTRHNSLVEGLIVSNKNLARRLGMRVIPQNVHDFYLRIVRDTIAFREKNKIKRNDFMDMLIDLKNRGDHDALSVEEVAAQAFVFFIAGYETSSTTMGFVLYELAKHQFIQDKAREEVKTVLAKHNDVFTYECMKEMVYLEMIYSETLRLYPVVPHLVRESSQRYETSDPNYVIDKGIMIFIPVRAIHLDPEYYPEPKKFIPERFTAEAIKQRPACTWLPFGDGPRNCIGLRFGKMQMSIGLAYLLKNYRFSLAPETEMPLKWGLQSLTIGAANGIRLKVERI